MITSGTISNQQRYRPT